MLYQTSPRKNLSSYVFFLLEEPPIFFDIVKTSISTMANTDKVPTNILCGISFAKMLSINKQVNDGKWKKKLNELTESIRKKYL